MLRSTDHHQQHERWLFLTRELIQSNIADMDLDPDSLSQVEAAFISAGLTKYQPLLLLLQYQRSNGRAFVDHLLVAQLTYAECKALAA